ncbi:2-isopropylmalate synthase [Sporomusaceae bacterium BoRhaA]|uniref:2-isopropylmalate synthase n=1 Tax=Pelorhabdus rhamnosifermentans TaxID=2772457 RepID=UPI001C064795|nr:2-isopropylmalate synthase [Pelorhabdus rhamnosifermentans]MBU2702219.1 2-isopropylmalate synthase [Pelorhabdus rhamnosifermentans]
MADKRIYIFDTTLRDGEQTPGVSLGADDKLEIARALAKLKVDVIEAGFPVASPGDFAAVRKVATQIKGPVIAALARASRNDIHEAYEALKYAEQPLIHTFLATSDIHMEYKLKMTRAQVLSHISEAVRYARTLVDEVEFSAEDASRSNWDFLCMAYSQAIAAGATVINVPDTVGYMVPEEFAKLIVYLRENITDVDSVRMSVHCHDDLGMAVANSLAGIGAGALQIETAMNGLGERAGNAALEEVVMALATRKDYFGCVTGLDTQQIYRTSRLVSTLSGILTPPNKAIVGDNAFAHESGIHQHGVLNNVETYEIMRPESIGIKKSRLVLGKHSGRHAFEERLQELGYQCSEERIHELFMKFKELADRKKTIFDEDLEALITEKTTEIYEKFRLLSHQVISGNEAMATATVRIETDHGIIEKACAGSGPLDALFNAIAASMNQDIVLKDFQLKAVTSGEDALGEALVRVERDGRIYSGRGISTDIIESSAKAYLQAVNKLCAASGTVAANVGVN